MERITNSMLDRKVEYLNRITGNPETPWTRDDSGLHANIGNYHISGAYGGVSLHQMMNTSGGVNDVFSTGHIPKRDLFNRICAYINGIETN